MGSQFNGFQWNEYVYICFAKRHASHIFVATRLRQRVTLSTSLFFSFYTQPPLCYLPYCQYNIKKYMYIWIISYFLHERKKIYIHIYICISSVSEVVCADWLFSARQMTKKVAFKRVSSNCTIKKRRIQSLEKKVNIILWKFSLLHFMKKITDDPKKNRSVCECVRNKKISSVNSFASWVFFLLLSVDSFCFNSML